MPLVLSSWIRLVGDVWLVGTHPEWGESSAADPLVIELEGTRYSGESISSYFISEHEAWAEEARDDPAVGSFVLPVASDRLHKANLSGGAPYGFRVPDGGADGVFASENDMSFSMPRFRVLIDNDIEWPPLVPASFVDADPIPLRANHEFILPRDKDLRVLVRLDITVINDGPGAAHFRFNELLTNGEDELRETVLLSGETLSGYLYHVERTVQEWIEIHNQRSTGTSPVHEFTVTSVSPMDTRALETASGGVVGGSGQRTLDFRPQDPQPGSEKAHGNNGGDDQDSGDNAAHTAPFYLAVGSSARPSLALRAGNSDS